MRISFFSLMLAFFVLSCGASAYAQAGTSSLFTTNLSFGSRGTQVTLLQQSLNRDPDTRIANTGVGSPGNETDYFGLLTKSAVVRFQEKYANEILVPAELTQGNGYVGSYTRTKLASLSASSTVSTNLSVVPSVIVPPITTPTPTIVPSPAIPASPNDSQNPNLENIDKFMAALDEVAAKKEISAVTLATFKQAVLKEIATTTDLRATFLKEVQKKSNQSMKDTSYMGGVLALIEQAFDKIFMPEHARAALGIPFGGALFFAYYCEDSFNWLITLEPLPPSFAALLSYVPFSQAFLSYNIPATPELLGEYEPGGVCVTACPACIVIPSEGTITPLVGSAPL